MIELSTAFLVFFIGGFGIGFIACVEYSRWREQKLERMRLARKPQPPIVTAMVKLGRAFEHAFVYGKPAPPLGEKEK